MSSDWPEVRLEDVTSILGDGLHGTPNYDENGEYCFINGNNLGNGKIIFDEKTKRASKEEYLKHKKNLNDRTILVSINGTIGNVGLYNGEKVFLGKSACYFNVLEEVDKQFVRYVVTSNYFQNYINSLATGSTIKNVSLKLMRNFTFRLPPLEVQMQISKVLEDLDDKIELNRQINQTLEHIAQTIFKSWFVDFEPVKAKVIAQEKGGDELAQSLAAQAIISGVVTLEQLENMEAGYLGLEHELHPLVTNRFPDQYGLDYWTPETLDQLAALFPDEFKASELGEIPKEWDYKKAEEITDVAIGKTPPRKESQWFSESPNDIKWVSIRDMGEVGIYALKTNEYLTEEAVNKFNVRRIPDNTILLSFKLTVGRLAITVGEMLSNEAIAHFNIFKDSALRSEYLYLYLRQFDFSSLGSTSSIATAVNSKTIKNVPILVPSSDVLKEFLMMIEPIFKELKILQMQNESLIELRDSLLPKLLSGEIDINNKQNKEVA